MAQNNAHLLTSLNSEEKGSMAGKSEPLIVAMNAGNAAGAKERQFEIITLGKHVPTPSG